MRFLAKIYRDRIDQNTAVMFAIALTYLPFLLSMQYSKHKWLVSQPERLWDYVTILHSEASLYLLLWVLVLVCIRSTWGSFFIFTSYYLMALLDNIAWFTAARPFHPADLARTLEFLTYYGDFLTTENIGWKRIVYAGVPLATAATLCLPATGRLYTPETGSSAGKATAAAAFAVMMVYAALAPAVLSPSYLHHNGLVRMAKQLYQDWKFAGGQMQNRDRERLFGAAQERVQVAGKRLNVILYVLETAPADYYPDLSPQIEPWAGRNGATVQEMREHYTSYPESDRSFFSMMTGNYPCLNRGSEWVKSYDCGRALPKVLGENGYRTYLFSVAPLNFHNLAVMVGNLGFRDAVESPATKHAYQQAKAAKRSLDRATLYDADMKLLEQALGVIAEERDQPYFLAYMPQSSHAPFQPPPGYHGPKGQRELLEANARWQVGLLQRMLDAVENAGSAQRTILVVAGDHGLRHPAESSLFEKQTILSPLTFKVAAAISYPKSLPPLQKGVTSHVDLTPTLLDLLGIRYRSNDYQGRSLVTAMPPRTVFFLGGEYLPVSGFTAKGWFFMESINRDQVHKSRAFAFDGARGADVAVVRDDAEREKISGDLRLMKVLLTR